MTSCYYSILHIQTYMDTNQMAEDAYVTQDVSSAQLMKTLHRQIITKSEYGQSSSCNCNPSLQSLSAWQQGITQPCSRSEPKPCLWRWEGNKTKQKNYEHLIFSHYYTAQWDISWHFIPVQELNWRMLGPSDMLQVWSTLQMKTSLYSFRIKLITTKVQNTIIKWLVH